MSKSTSTFADRDQISGETSEISSRTTESPVSSPVRDRPVWRVIPVAKPPDGLSPSEAVEWWIDELTDWVGFIRSMMSGLRSFDDDRSPSARSRLLILPSRMPRRFKDHDDRMFVFDIDHNDSLVNEAISIGDSLAGAIRSLSPEIGPAQFPRFVDARDGRTWVALSYECPLDPDDITFDLIDRSLDRDTWQPCVDQVVVFAPGRAIRLELGWLRMNDFDYDIAIGDDGTATLA